MSRETSTLNWPSPSAGQARLTLLGSPHLANPGNDEHNLAVDDTLTTQRQTELQTICAHLEERQFDHVALEIPRAQQTALDEQYETVRNGLPIDDEGRFPEGPARIRGEAVQIGFRLARSLGLDRVEAVDSHPDPPDIDSGWAIDEEPADVPYPLPDIEQLVEAERRRLQTSELLDVLRVQNRADHLRVLHAGNITASFSSSERENYTGSRQIGFWYERNARMLENLHRVTNPEEETLFIVGGSHVLPLKQLAQADPRSCPRSPLPLLK